MTSSAKIIADSISPLGVRLTTFEVVTHRFVLAEFNTHRLFSRNSASSRAIPVEKQLERLQHTAWPVEWPREQAGMQGGDALDGQPLQDAQELFAKVYGFTYGAIQEYLESHPDKSERLHKSLINRLMEPFMWHTIVVTSTEWDNFWFQRASEFSPLAQPELRATVDLMLDAYRAGEPTRVEYDEWHLPYITDEDRKQVADAIYDPTEHDRTNTEAINEALKKISTARCARVSYLTQDGRRDPEEDVRLYERLVSARPMHASPLEHVATPARLTDHVSGNITGWHQHRHEVMPHRLDSGART